MQAGCMKFEKQRDGKILRDIHYKLRQVKIGVDAELDNITSCVVEFPFTRELSDALARDLAAFDAAVSTVGTLVRIADWRNALIKTSGPILNGWQKPRALK